MSRRKGLVVAAIVAAAVLIAGGSYAVTRFSGIGAGDAERAPSAPAGTSDSSCGLVGTRGDEVTVPARWENVAGYQLPVSTTDGPRLRDQAGAWSCFSHTRSGAVLAGYVIPMRAEGIASDWQAVVREQTMPGPGQKVKLQSTPTAGPEPVTIRGFNVAGYADDRATIAYYLHTPSLDASCTADLRWYKGDWRLELEEDGSTLSGCTPGIPAEFTPWGP
jgi:hypothetical protein